MRHPANLGVALAAALATGCAIGPPAGPPGTVTNDLAAYLEREWPLGPSPGPGGAGCAEQGGIGCSTASGDPLPGEGLEFAACGVGCGGPGDWCGHLRGALPKLGPTRPPAAGAPMHGEHGRFFPVPVRPVFAPDPSRGDWIGPMATPAPAAPGGRDGKLGSP